MEALHYHDILARLDGLRPGPTGRTWYARCPVHEDRHPSLFLWVSKKDGALMARCQASYSCKWSAIVAALGTQPRDWFPPRDDSMRETTRPKIVATYDYRDEHGGLAYQVVRFEPKSFRQRRPALPTDRPETVHNGWVWNVEGIPRVLYRLSELLANDSPVLVVEGEKDVEALRNLGFTATTNAGGSGAWQLDLACWLADRRVAVIPDNDEQGLRWAVQVLGSCVFFGARSVRLVSLPGLKIHGDVSDWLFQLPYTMPAIQKRQMLCQLIRQVPEWRAHKDQDQERNSAYVRERQENVCTG
jgi:putative DNA primase/helicase